jgi:AcrR family transcriptional regulator
MRTEPKAAANKKAKIKTGPKRGKREAILDAMFDVVVERGFHEAPMSLIVERAGASAGVIYHHFESKEAIILAVYDRVRALKRASMLAGYRPEMDAKEAFLMVSANAYRFYREHAREMRFMEQYENAGFACMPEPESALDAAEVEFQRRFASRSRGGILADLPQEVLHEMTIGTVMRLAKLPRELSPEELRGVAERMWVAVKG